MKKSQSKKSQSWKKSDKKKVSQSVSHGQKTWRSYSPEVSYLNKFYDYVDMMISANFFDDILIEEEG